MGGKSKSSSTSSSVTNTTNIDRRQVVAEGAFGIAADGATVNIQSIDGGIVQSALDTVKANDATNGASFTQLLTLADKLFTGAGKSSTKPKIQPLNRLTKSTRQPTTKRAALTRKRLSSWQVRRLVLWYLKRDNLC